MRLLVTVVIDDTLNYTKSTTKIVELSDDTPNEGIERGVDETILRIIKNKAPGAKFRVSYAVLPNARLV